MKAIDTVAAVLLVVGGLNWGLVGLFGINLVSGILGDMTATTRLVYLLVGACAVYQGLNWKAIQRRWNLAPQPIR